MKQKIKRTSLWLLAIILCTIGACTEKTRQHILEDPTSNKSDDGGSDSSSLPNDLSALAPDAGAPPKDTSIAVEQPAVKPKPATGGINYGEAYQMTTLFFAWNALGKLSDHRVPQRSDSQSDGEFSGGYADAGDNILFGKAHSAVVAQNGLQAYIYKQALIEMGQYDETLVQLKHGTDWLLKAHEIENGKTKSLVVQLSDGDTDHNKWLTIEETTFYRPIYRVTPNNPGSDYAGLAAAGMAFGALNFTGDYRDKLINSAKIALQFGKDHRGLGHQNGINTVYKNANGDEDELALGAMALYLATNEKTYLDYAKNILDATYLGGWAGGYEHQEQLVTLLIAHYDKDAQYANRLREYFNNWRPGGFSGQVSSTPEGYLIFETGWGSAGAVSPAINYMGLWHTLTGESTWADLVKKQMDYNLGKNSRQSSLMCGFKNEKNCSRIHHRGAAGGSKTVPNGDNLYQLWGGFLAGPTKTDWDWKNDRSDWKGNEPTITYNINFQGVLAYLYSLYGGVPMSDGALQTMLNSWKGF